MITITLAVLYQGPLAFLSEWTQKLSSEHFNHRLEVHQARLIEEHAGRLAVLHLNDCANDKFEDGKFDGDCVAIRGPEENDINPLDFGELYNTLDHTRTSLTISRYL